MNYALPIELERPPFGQVARQLLRLPGEALQSCLQQQRESGGRLGEILRGRGLLTDADVREVLKIQARWVYQAALGDVADGAAFARSSFSLVLPAYNEEANIKDTLEGALAILPEIVPRFEIVVVNDGSRDQTAEIVGGYARRDGRVRCISHEHNRGYGAAVTTGLRAARGDLIAFTDADGQFSLLDLPHLLALLESSDVVVGYRYQRADKWIRRVNAWGWNQLIRLVLGVRIRDLDCAFKVFRRGDLDRLGLTATGAGINAEIMVQCTRGGLTIRETPVRHYARHQGQPTGANFKVILRAFRELPRLLKYRLSRIPLAGSVPHGPTAVAPGLG
jgi:hypothetical protein